MRDVFADLKTACARLEARFRDIQDIEFTVQEGKLFILQTRAGKRSTQAALKIAVDMAGEGVITRAEAVKSINANQLDQLLHPTLDPTRRWKFSPKAYRLAQRSVGDRVRR
jgi:pyruvate,orthophosphate dikinase